MSEVDHNQAVREITQTLKGPVAAVFRRMVPAFAEIKAEDFYDSVLASPDLLHGCLMIFRKRRDSFSHLLKDADGRLVNDDFVRLRCGRSVHDIIAMIVRTHAKRHFRATLGGDPNDPKSEAGKLYAAMNEYLIHEWQVPLTKAYAELPIEAVMRMGPAILDLKTTAAVEAVTAAISGMTPSSGKVPVTQVTAHAPANDVAPRKAAEPQMEVIDQREMDFWWETLNDPSVRNVLGRMTENEMRELTAAFCGVGEATRGQLLAPLGLSLYQAAVMFTSAYRVLGRAGFTQMFGKTGTAASVGGFAKKLQARNVSSRSDLKSIQTASEAALQSAPKQAAGGRR